MANNIMFVGVGGQGTLLASRIIGNVLLDLNFDVKVSEVHGMSQRGGSVVTYVKYGDKVNSPLIEKGEADVIVAFEQLEALRWLSFLKIGGNFIVSTQKIDPMPVITGAAKYPENIIEKLKNAGAKISDIDALDLAKKAGSAKAVNVVLIGVLAKYLNVNKDLWLKALNETVPSKFLDLNIKAFELGYNY